MVYRKRPQHEIGLSGVFAAEFYKPLKLRGTFPNALANVDTLSFFRLLFFFPGIFICLK